MNIQQENQVHFAPNKPDLTKSAQQNEMEKKGESWSKPGPVPGPQDQSSTQQPNLMKFDSPPVQSPEKENRRVVDKARDVLDSVKERVAPHWDEKPHNQQAEQHWNEAKQHGDALLMLL
jgi:hypothetical protein